MSKRHLNKDNRTTFLNEHTMGTFKNELLVLLVFYFETILILRVDPKHTNLHEEHGLPQPELHGLLFLHTKQFFANASHQANGAQYDGAQQETCRPCRPAMQKMHGFIDRGRNQNELPSPEPGS